LQSNAWTKKPQGSTINANGANCSNAGSIGIYAIQGSTINAYSANARKDETTDQTTDMGIVAGVFGLRWLISRKGK
jgi:hypothetical protein